MLREPLIQECVVGVEKVHDAAVLFDYALEKQFRLTAHRLPQVIVEIRKEPRVRARSGEIPEVQPLLGETAHEGFRTRIGHHAPHLFLEYSRILKLASDGKVEQFIVGNAAPQEKRQT